MRISWWATAVDIVIYLEKNYTVRILFCLDLTKTNVKCIVYMSQSPFEHQISELFIDS